MIKTIAALGLFSACVIAQQGEPPFPMVITGPTAVDSRLVSLDRHWEDEQGLHFTLTNHYSKPITAVAFLVSRYTDAGLQKGQGLTHFDSVMLHWSELPIEPNVQHTFTLGTYPYTHTYEMAAVVFSDGTTSGDPRAIQAIQNKRKVVAQMLPAVIAILRRAQANGTSKDAIITQLNACEKDVFSTITDRYAKPVPAYLRQDAVDSITKASNLNTVLTKLIDDYTRWLARFS